MDYPDYPDEGNLINRYIIMAHPYIADSHLCVQSSLP